MTEYLGKQYVPVNENFFAGSAVELAPSLIGCVLHHNNRGKDIAIMIAEDEAYRQWLSAPFAVAKAA
jgi:DNA-3-methyladenine glycosylase